MYSKQFIDCAKCGNKVSSMDLDHRDICTHCRTRGKSSSWQLKEQKRLEKQNEKTEDPKCYNCEKPKSYEGYCRYCGK